ncbi:MAG: hypothetical protein K2X81_06420, partial [Candidatus Obscuribacterales bacterium]|nr:hypothetical protein [Candidatus Obscuribacterales bacterium]
MEQSNNQFIQFSCLLASLLICTSCNHGQQSSVQSSGDRPVVTPALSSSSFSARLNKALGDEAPSAESSSLLNVSMLQQSAKMEEAELRKLEGKARRDKLEQMKDQLVDSEKIYGKNSLAIVPLLVSLSIADDNDRESSAYSNRCLNISSGASISDVDKEQASIASRYLVLLADSNTLRPAYLPGRVDSSAMLELALLLQVKSDGWNSYSSELLAFITPHLLRASRHAEVCDIIKVVLDYAQRTKSIAKIDPSGQLRCLYINCLRSAGREKEIGPIQEQLTKLQEQMQKAAVQRVDNALDAA